MQATAHGGQTPPRESRGKVKGLHLNMQSTHQAEQEARMLASKSVLRGFVSLGVFVRAFYL